MLNHRYNKNILPEILKVLNLNYQQSLSCPLSMVITRSTFANNTGR